MAYVTTQAKSPNVEAMCYADELIRLLTSYDIASIAALNSVAVDFLTKCKYGEALKVFDFAYASLKGRPFLTLATSAQSSEIRHQIDSPRVIGGAQYPSLPLYRKEYHHPVNLNSSSTIRSNAFNFVQLGFSMTEVAGQIPSEPATIIHQMLLQAASQYSGLDRNAFLSSFTFTCQPASHCSNDSTTQSKLPFRIQSVRIESLSEDSTPRSEIFTNSVAMKNDLDLQASPSNNFVVYYRAFIFCDTTVHSLLSDVSIRKNYDSIMVCYIPAIVSYNIALTMHRLAIQEGNDKKYERALSLYEYSWILLRGTEKTVTGNEYFGLEIDIVLLALTNNMGQIHSHFLRTQESKVCLERLLSIFLLSHSKRLLTTDEYIFFYMNILVGLSRNPIFAPAA